MIIENTTNEIDSDRLDYVKTWRNTEANKCLGEENSKKSSSKEEYQAQKSVGGQTLKKSTRREAHLAREQWTSMGVRRPKKRLHHSNVLDCIQMSMSKEKPYNSLNLSISGSTNIWV